MGCAVFLLICTLNINSSVVLLLFEALKEQNGFLFGHGCLELEFVVAETNHDCIYFAFVLAGLRRNEDEPCSYRKYGNIVKKPLVVGR